MSLKFAILAVLSHRDRTGYELTRKMDGSVANFWPATHQQIYQELKKLDASGLVHFKEKKQLEKPDKKIYSITRGGHAALKGWISEPLEPTPSKDALLIKLFAGHLVSGEVLLDELSKHEKTHRSKLVEYRQIERDHFLKRALPPELLSQYLGLRKGILYEEGWLRWCRESMEKIRQSRRGPASH